MTLGYIIKLDLNSQKTNVKAQKINNSFLEIYDIASAKFLI